MGINTNLKAMIFLALLVFAAYFNSLQNDFVSDDIDGIVKNAEIGKISYIAESPSVFLLYLPRFLIVKTFGMAPWAFRLCNILLHLGAVLAAYFLLSSLADRKIALFGAMLFAVHPLQAEAVTWISGGQYAQCGFFILLALLLYANSLKHKKIYWPAFLVFTLWLFSSERSVIFPLILLLFMLAFEDIHKGWRKLIPFFAIDCIWLAIYLGRIGGRINALEKVSYQSPQILNPLIQIPIAITSYFELVFWPKNLTLYHSEMSFTYFGYSLRLAIFSIFLGSIIYSYRKNRFIFFWLSFFFVTLLPTLTPLGISWIVAERYVYLGTLGIFAVLALFFKRLGRIRRLRVAGNILLGLIIFSLMLRTVMRNRDWKNEDNLWLATAKTSPSSPNTHNNLGDVYSRSGDLEKAAQEFSKAIAINPHYADAYHNLANTYLNMGRLKEALDNYQLAVSFNPELWQSYQNMAAIYFERGEYALAEECLLKALKINPENQDLRLNLERLYKKRGDASFSHAGDTSQN